MYHDILAGHPDTATALIGGGRSISFGQLRDRVARTAAALVAAGVRPGQPVVVLGDNDTAFATGVLAAFRSGAVACPLSPATPQSVLAERLQALEPVALVASPAAAESALANRAAGLVTRIGVPAGSESSDLPSFDVPAQASSPAPESTATALVLHTSGIIGAPRAAVLNHDDISASQRRIAAADIGVEAGTVVFSALPPTHVLGLNMALLTYLGVGATVVLQERFDAVGALDLIERYKVTSIVSVPPMWAAWLDLAGGRSDVMHSMANARTGASALHPDIAQAVHANFGVDLIQGYGLTETAGTVTLERSARLHPGSVGRPLDGVEIRLVDRGDVVETGDRGEVWIGRSPSSRGTATTRRRRPRSSSPTGGAARATSASRTTTARCTSWAAARTSSTSRGSTSPRPRSRPSSSSTRRCTRRSWSANRTR